MRLHNTLTRQDEEFKPASQPVSLYTCGPTVYSYYHVGNLRNAVFNDTLRRALAIAGHKVEHVMNVTDVGHLVSDADEGEDKLEKGAAREGKTVWEVAEFYTNAFKRDVAALNILPATKLEKATDHIDDQLAMIQTLLDKGFAYQAEQAIYFDVTKVSDYGKLSGQALGDKAVGAREEVVTDPEKHHPQDFALWFFTVGHFKDHTMRWESPWGEGFPGWHLECSAIIKATLGDTIDIHTGGIDHIGTHHTNEIAQSEAANGQPLARYWLHNEFVLVDGRKMSKSLDNLVTLADIEEKGFEPLALRLFMLQSHFQSETNFTWDGMAAAQSRLLKLRNLADLRWQPSGEATKRDFSEHTNAMQAALTDNLNTPKVLEQLAALERELDLQPLAKEETDAFGKLLEWLDDALGLNLSQREDLTGEQKSILQKRADARAAKDFDRSDELRAELAGQLVFVRDTPRGQVWQRVPTD